MDCNVCIININVYNLTLNMYFCQPFPSKLHLDCKGLHHVLIHSQGLSLLQHPFFNFLDVTNELFYGSHKL